MTGDSLRLLAACVRASGGTVLLPEQSAELEARLIPLATAAGLADVDTLVSRLRGRLGCGDALERQVIEAVTGRDSQFFFDQAPLMHLLVRPPGQPLRLWSAATGSGQEAYSLAMQIAPGDRPIAILATDIDPAQLARAQAGRYTQAEIQRGLPIAFLLRHFTQENGEWQIATRLRRMVVFRQHDLRDGPAGSLPHDLILCRHVLGYFDPETRSRVLESLQRQLADDGYLWCGPADAILDVTDRFAATTEPGLYRPVSSRAKRAKIASPCSWLPETALSFITG